MKGSKAQGYFAAIGYGTDEALGSLKDLIAKMEPGYPGSTDVLDQVAAIGKQLLGGSCDGLVDWAKEQGIAPEPVEWTMQI